MNAQDFDRLLHLAFEKGALSRLIASSPKSKTDTPRRLNGRLAKQGDTTVLSVEACYDGGALKHTHYRANGLSSFLTDTVNAFGQVRITALGKEATLLSSKKGTVTVTGGTALLRALEDASAYEVTAGIDRRKNRMLSGSEPFLCALGISDTRGRVHDKRQAKFRQICRFLEHVAAIYAELPTEGCLTVYDLCCGKSYLSFALYHYLTAVRDRRVKMLCIDLKRDVIAECAAIAAQLGFDGMKFCCDDVRNAPKDKTPDLLISLHACDVATDIVLDTGIALGARVILSTPCCHRTLSAHINAAPLAFAVRHPQIRTKLCEALTDALRVLRLQKAGYSVTALELTDPDNTPKNTQIRAILPRNTSKSTAHAKRAAAEYEAALTLLLGDASKEHLIRGLDL